MGHIDSMEGQLLVEGCMETNPAELEEPDREQFEFGVVNMH
jgi:hypothetical protein